LLVPSPVSEAEFLRDLGITPGDLDNLRIEQPWLLSKHRLAEDLDVFKTVRQRTTDRMSVFLPWRLQAKESG